MNKKLKFLDDGKPTAIFEPKKISLQRLSLYPKNPSIKLKEKKP